VSKHKKAYAEKAALAAIKNLNRAKTWDELIAYVVAAQKAAAQLQKYE
jgi:hypothetical protein